MTYKPKYKFSSLYRTNRKEYYRRKNIVEGLKKFRKNEKVMQEQITKAQLKKYTYHIKLNYKSADGSKDHVIESKIEIVSDHEPTQKEIKKLVYDNLDQLAGDDMDFIHNIPYQSFVAGLTDISNTEKEAGIEFFKTIFSHNL